MRIASSSIMLPLPVRTVGSLVGRSCRELCERFWCGRIFCSLGLNFVDCATLSRYGLLDIDFSFSVLGASM